MIEKIVSIEIPALEVTATKAVVAEYRAEEGVVVYDLYADDNLVAKSRYSLIADAPFELTQEDIDILNPPVVEEEV